MDIKQHFEMMFTIFSISWIIITSIEAGFRILHDMFTDMNGGRAGVENIAVLITDRLPEGKEEGIKGEADLAKAKDIRIIAVCISKQVNCLLKKCTYQACLHWDITNKQRKDKTNLLETSFHEVNPMRLFILGHFGT